MVTSKLTRDDEEVTVAFPDHGVKRLLASLANLEVAGSTEVARGSSSPRFHAESDRVPVHGRCTHKPDVQALTDPARAATSRRDTRSAELVALLAASPAGPPPRSRAV